MIENESLKIDWQFVISSILTALIVLFTWRSSRLHKKQLNEMAPWITGIEVKRPELGHLSITVVNTKPYRITPTNVYYRRKIMFGLFALKHTVKWEYPRAVKGDRMVNKPYIDASEEMNIYIKNFDPKSIYRICVETSGGTGQAIYFPIDEKKQ